MAFLWFNEDVPPHEGKRVQLDIQQKFVPDSYQSGDIARATLEIAPDKRPWNKAQAFFPGVMCESAALPRETFHIKWVSKGIRVSVNSAPCGALPVFITACLHYNRGNMGSEP